MSIKTTSQLRAYLSRVMSGIEDGTVSLEKAGAIQKMAGRINESMYAEAKIRHMVAPNDQTSRMGSMTIHDEV